jgi:hypothetical protein
MAVTQISRIQHRRGLEQDLPQLASAELGWSIDTRQLYIGNGTLSEGAPVEGVTRILTENDIDDITSNTSFTNYTFQGTAAGYTAQTGPSALFPVSRTFQQKFDDTINIRDFGAIGDNTTDDTIAINRAIQQIYKSTVSPNEPRARRTIYFPGGTYLTTSEILIPPYAKIIGDGPGSTTIRQTIGNKTVANLCDSSFQTGASLGSGSAVLPRDIEISGINFYNSNLYANLSVINIDSASNIKITSCKFQHNFTSGFYPNLITLHSTVSPAQKISIDTCQFNRAGNAISSSGDGINTIRVFNSFFTEIANVVYDVRRAVGITSIGNYYDFSPGSLSLIFQSNGSNRNHSIADNTVVTDRQNSGGIQLGNLTVLSSMRETISTTPLLVPIDTDSYTIRYKITQNSPASPSGYFTRYGTFNFSTDGSNVSIVDDYVETPITVNANVTANTTHFIVSTFIGTANLEYSISSLSLSY